MAQSHSDIYDPPIFDPDKDRSTLEQNHANGEFNRACSYVKDGAAHDDLSLSVERGKSRHYPVMPDMCV
jgi:hypothetical protein